MDAARRLYGVFDRLSPGWKVRRPRVPASCSGSRAAGDRLARGCDRRSRAPGHTPVLERGLRSIDASGFANRDEDVRAMADDRQVDLAWLCEQIFGVEPGEQRRRYYSVLYVSRAPRQRDDRQRARRHRRGARGHPLPGAGRFTRARTSRRIGTSPPPLVGGGPDRRHGRRRRMERALAQFQAMVSLGVARRRPWQPESRHRLQLDGVVVRDRAERARRLRRVAHGLARRAAAGTRTSARRTRRTTRWIRICCSLIAGPAAGSAIVEWEGTRYRVDFAKAEATQNRVVAR